MDLRAIMISRGIIECFRIVRLEEAVGIYKHLLGYGYSMADLEQYLVSFREKEQKGIEIERKKLERMRKEWLRAWEIIAPLCPICGGFLNQPRHICKKKGLENVLGYTCLWHCENGDCIYEHYTYEDAGEELKKLMEKGKEEG